MTRWAAMLTDAEAQIVFQEVSRFGGEDESALNRKRVRLLAAADSEFSPDRLKPADMV
jgi:hypothetical protein